jgi:hypothetical protein
VLIVLPTEYVTGLKMACNLPLIKGKIIHTVPKLTNLGSETNESGFRN